MPFHLLLPFPNPKRMMRTREKCEQCARREEEKHITRLGALLDMPGDLGPALSVWKI